MRKIFIICLALLTGPVSAQDVALLGAIRDYSFTPKVGDAYDLLNAQPNLERQGIQVIRAAEMDGALLRSVVARLDQLATGNGRIIVALSGHFVHSASDTWFVAKDSRGPDLSNIGASGFSVSVLAEIAGRAPGGAVLLLGESGNSSVASGKDMRNGVGRVGLPQGVALVHGPADEIAGFASQGLPQKGQPLARLVKNWPGLKARGFLSELVPFRPGQPSVGSSPQVTSRVAPSAENDLWRVTQQIGTEQAYQNYLTRYPRGQFAGAARTAIQEIRTAPARAAEAEEDALRLGRDARRQIQRNLTLLGYDTRGIDGIFGRGSRAAIQKWQTANGENATGFMTRAQLLTLRRQAERRSAELEAEAERRRVELEIQDREFWITTGQSGSEAGLRTYLERYPEGIYAEVAKNRLAPFDEARRAQAAAQDRADWDFAVQTGTLASYRLYLAQNPDGAFVEQARLEIKDLEFRDRNREALQAAARNEERLGLNQATRRLVETRLTKLGLKPGPADGTFDRSTRRAIKRYQKARKLKTTGFLDQATVVRLLADSVLR